jgi:hypothetical protein
MTTKCRTQADSLRELQPESKGKAKADSCGMTIRKARAKAEADSTRNKANAVQEQRVAEG